MIFSDFPLHHAILVTHANRPLYAASLWKEVSQLSPAHRYFDQTVLDIDTARAIISYAQSPYNEEKIAIISFHTASIPAQNAMLKILEDPRENMRFVLITTNKGNLIETVLSRVRHVELSQTEENSSLAEEFLMTAPQLRMKIKGVADILSKEDEEGRKDRESVKSFIMALATLLSERSASPSYRMETLEIASYASDPSASGKALVEYLSLLLPQTK